MTVRWLFNRLCCMSVAEVAQRAGRALVLPRLRPLAPEADGVVFARPGAPALDAAERAALLLEAASIDAGRVPLFACHAVEPGGERGPVPDWNAAIDPADIKYTWELNRHLHLVRLAQAWALTGAARWRASVLAQLGSWLAQCPPATGPNWRSSLELGIRLINWSLVWQLLQGQVDSELHRQWLASIRAHCLFIAARLSRHSSANNHLIGELAGLYVAACTWPCWPESPTWRAQAQRELEEQIQLQFHADGVHREQSCAYHGFCCDFLWLAGVLGQAAGQPFSGTYWTRLQRARDFTRAAGQIAANMGDADDGCVWRLQSGRRGGGARVWLAHLFPGPPPPVVAAQPAWAFPDAGYYLFGAQGRVRGLVDCGPLGYLGIAAHGHADALSVLLQVDGAPVLVDAGTYGYWRDARWRDYFRGTSAHNTLRVDGLDQSVGGGRFLWRRKAQSRIETAPGSPTDFFLAASHDGYMRLPDPVRHRRSVRFADNVLVVQDRLLGRRAHRSEIFWHVAPHLAVQLVGQGMIVRSDRYTLRLEVSCGALDLVRGADHPPLGWYAQHYDRKTPCTVLRIVNESSDVQVECRITISFFVK